jgi:hypothetical protein
VHTAVLLCVCKQLGFQAGTRLLSMMLRNACRMDDIQPHAASCMLLLVAAVAALGLTCCSKQSKLATALYMSSKLHLQQQSRW